jgi:predicted O-methyltransferase YrrM
VHITTLLHAAVPAGAAGAIQRWAQDRYEVARARLRRPNIYNLKNYERVGAIYAAPSEMSRSERLFLFALVRGARPERLLEIGTRFGGSASIMAAALEDARVPGRIIGVDPAPEMKVAQKALFSRFQLLRKPSPQALPEARELAGGPFDFVLIDGIHVYEQVTLDIAGVLPFLADGAYVLFHDAFHFGVSKAIAEAVRDLPEFHDCGYVCSKPATKVGLVPMGGFRLLRFEKARITSPQRYIERTCRAADRPVPEFREELINHDAWYCREVQPCPHCQRIRREQEARQSEMDTERVLRGV